MTRYRGFLACVVLGTSLSLVHAQTPQTPEAAVEAGPSNSALTGELMYQLLLGELNAVGGEPGVGYSLLMDAARKTGDTRLYKRATDIALQNRSGESALQASRAWLQAAPDSRDANRYLLQILLGLNRPAEALEPLRKELGTADQSTRLGGLNSLPRLFARVSDKKLAANIVEQAVTEYLPSPIYGAAAWSAVGMLRLEASDRSGALTAAQRAQALDVSGEAPALLGINLMLTRQAGAEDLMRAYLAGKPRPEIRENYARALHGLQRHKDAADQIAIVTREKPSLASAWLLKGLIEQQQRDYDNAQLSLRRYVTLQRAAPDSPEGTLGLTKAYMQLAEMAVQHKRYREALGWLDQIDDSEEALNVQSRRGALLAREGRLEEARALIRGIPEKDSGDAKRKIIVEADLLRDNKQYQTAYELVREALINSPLDVDLMTHQAMLAEKLGRMDEMERLLRLAISAKPDNPYAYNALGYSFADRNVRLPEARQLIRKALELAPDNASIIDSLGWLEFRSGKLAEARTLLTKAYADQPDAEIAAHLGEVLWMLGERAQANTIWNEGLTLNDDNETLVETLKRLRPKP